jgi:hypothetical protein
MSEKITPGDWRVDETVALGAYGVWSGDKQICRVRLGSDGAIPREERDANARLIAAAPELLAACKAALYQIQELDDVLNHSGHDVVGWHLNGESEPVSTFFTDSDKGAAEKLIAALAKAGLWQ